MPDSESFRSYLKNLLTKLIKSLPQAQTGSILVRRDEILEYEACFGYDLEQLRKTHLRLNQIMGQEERVKLVRDLQSWDYGHLDEDQISVLETYGGLLTIQSMITFPIRVNDIIWGEFNIENHSSKEAFTIADVELVETYSRLVEQELENRIREKELDERYSDLYRARSATEKILDIYFHNLRNNFQVLLLVAGQNQAYPQIADMIQVFVHDFDNHFLELQESVKRNTAGGFLTSELEYWIRSPNVNINYIKKILVEIIDSLSSSVLFRKDNLNYEEKQIIPSKYPPDYLYRYKILDEYDLVVQITGTRDMDNNNVTGLVEAKIEVIAEQTSQVIRRIVQTIALETMISQMIQLEMTKDQVIKIYLTEFQRFISELMDLHLAENQKTWINYLSNCADLVNEVAVSATQRR